MAIKISNQITFTEQKKILSIEEWYLATNYDSNITVENGDWGTWTKEVQTINASKPYLWNYEKVIYSLGEPSYEASDPIIIGVYSKSDGRGIDTIINEYFLTETPELPEIPEWSRDSSTAAGLTPIFKYLWNREIIVYTDGAEQPTDPAIIGVYGDSGTDAVDFQIYSVDGFEFSEGLDSITLNTVAFQGGETVENNATYQWKWWNSEVSAYQDITIDINGELVKATSESLTVNRTDAYALSSIKCVMTYDNIAYEDYVTLTEKSTIYTSVIKFFDGSNIFDSSKPYIVAYIETYKDNQCEESINTNRYYDGESFLNSGVIETDIEPEEGEQFNNNDLMYFIYKQVNGSYDIVLGEYMDNSWHTNDNFTNKYVYTNNINTNSTSNIIVISKESVSRSQELNVQVYRKTEEAVVDVDTSNLTQLTSCSATIVDINDPIISDIEPTNAKDGQLWLDTSVNPYALKIYTVKSKYDYRLGDAIECRTPESTDTRYTSSYSYADHIEISNSGVATLLNPTTINIGYSTLNDALILKNKFLKQDIDMTETIYYVAENASIGQMSIDSSKFCLYIDGVQQIFVEEIEYGEWVYFSQQNGGSVYTSIPLDGYSAGDLWIISDEDALSYKGIYPNLFNKFGSGTMLKTNTTSNEFNELHWTDSMEDISSTIKNIKETFSWGNDGLKIMRKVTDENGNESTPFYVHIDSTRMGFHSVTYKDGQKDKDAEIVHIGINSAVIKNASFIDDTVEPEYTKYEQTNGVLFDCETKFNQSVTMQGTTNNNTIVGFKFQIEKNGSLSLVIT